MGQEDDPFQKKWAGFMSSGNWSDAPVDTDMDDAAKRSFQIKRQEMFTCLKEMDARAVKKQKQG